MTLGAINRLTVCTRSTMTEKEGLRNASQGQTYELRSLGISVRNGILLIHGSKPMHPMQGERAMPDTETEIQPPRSLKDFYALMAATTPARRRLVEAVLDRHPPDSKDLATLQGTLRALLAIPEREGGRVLRLDETREMRLDLGYEVEELKKDILYLEQGEKALLNDLRQRHEDFDAHVRRGLTFLKDIAFNCFISDRDGTTNNYCGRYRSSIQSVYNAVFLTRFARRHVTNPILLTSAPLLDGGIVEVSVTPPRTFVYAASKGRECLDLTGRRRVKAIPEDKQKVLQTLNIELGALLKNPAYEKFSLIGSGLQHKFGQTTVARQDIGGSVPEDESLSFLERVKALMLTADPHGHFLRMEDTGLDIEIILTIEHHQEGLKDFDKGDGVAYLDETLSLNLAQGAHLVCGDTNSDLPMLRVAQEYSNETFAVFVTRKPELKQKVAALCPDTLIVPEPDILVTVLGMV